MLNGEWQDRGFLSGEIQSTIIDTSGEPQEKVVKPSIVPVVVEADAGKKLTKVTVEAVSSDIDVDIQPDDIREGVEILGVVGTLEPKEDIDAELNEQDTLLAELQSSVDELQEKPYDRLQWICDNVKRLGQLFNTYTGDNVDNVINGLDTSKVKWWDSTFRNATKLTHLPTLNTTDTVGLSNAFNGCEQLKEVNFTQTKNITSWTYTFQKSGIEKLYLDMSSAESIYSICQECPNLTEAIFTNLKPTNVQYSFYNSRELVTLQTIDLVNATSGNLGNFFFNNSKLTNLILKNIRLTLQIGSGRSWGDLLTMDSLLNTIKELWTNTGTSTKKLTVGTANLEKLANVYVKLIDITDEMRAEDEYIDNKAPFIQCESTDEGAMLITEYVTTVKNWQIA